MIVGTASVNWGYDPLYSWTSPPSFDVMLDQMARSGYAGTEISYHFPADVPALKRSLEARNLRAASAFHEVSLLDSANHRHELQRVIPVADRLQALGSDILILSDHTTRERLKVAGMVNPDGSDGLSETQWTALADGLAKIGEYLRSRGMEAVFHPHVGTYVETREEVDRLCRITDPELLGLCPDTGHLAYGGSDPEALIVDYASRVRYMHLKDIDSNTLQTVKARHLTFPQAVELGLFVPLGTGMVDFVRMIGALRGAAYDGWLIVEQDAPDDPLEAALQSRAYLRAQFGL